MKPTFREFLSVWKKEENAFKGIKVVATEGKPAWIVAFIYDNNFFIAILKGSGKGNIVTPTWGPDRVKVRDG
jgi:hypothetical protein